jgi:diaminopimelate decarboxylase
MNARLPPAGLGTPAPTATRPALTASLLAEHFPSPGNDLVIGGVTARDLVQAHGSPLYVVDQAILEQRYRSLQAAVAGFAEVYYSIKANPQPAVAGTFVALGAGLEIASGAEFLLARAAGCAPGRMLFAGPGKGRSELRLALAGGLGEIHLESFEEVELVADLAAELGVTPSVALRINPSAAAQGGAMRMGGKPAAFGFDEEQMADAAAAVARHPRLRLDGLHLFAGTQILQADVLLQQWHIGLDLATQLARIVDRPLKRVDLGGGLGIPYHAGQTPLDLTLLAAGVPALQATKALEPLLSNAEVLIEPGRWLTGPAGVYLMTVRAVKASRGERFVVCDGGMHHHLAASGNLGQVIKRDYPLLAADRLQAPLLGRAQVVGPLCTPLDTLGRETELPDMRAGDLVAVLQSGAYALSASPVGFLSHPMPAEVMVRSGRHWCLREAGQHGVPLVNLPGLTLPARA